LCSQDPATVPYHPRISSLQNFLPGILEQFNFYDFHKVVEMESWQFNHYISCGGNATNVWVKFILGLGVIRMSTNMNTHWGHVLIRTPFFSNFSMDI
jgi:hypothetical protein